MKITVSLLALAASAVLYGVAPGASAQTPPASAIPAAQPAPQPMPAAPPAAAPVAATPVPATPVPAEPEKVAAAPKPHLSACARAIKVSERKLDKSTADASVIAAAWQHIEEAKKTKGSVCQEHAKQAADML